MVKVKQKMGPKLEGKVVKKGRRGAKKPKVLKLQAEDEEVALNPGNIQNMGDQAGNGSGGDDLSLLSKPVEVNATGVRQLLKIFQNTTVELQDLLSTECDLVYECKVCRSLYRSVANFLSHKRSYCKEQYSDTRHVFSTSHRVEDQLVIIQPEPVPEMPSSETWKTGDSQAVSHPSVTSDENNLVTAEIKVSVPPISSYIRPKRNLSQIVEDLVKKLPNEVSSEPVGPVSAVQFYTRACEKVLAQRDVRKEQTLHLEPMQGTSCGVFQTVIPPASSVENTDLMKTQVAELHGMVSANEATLGPVGEITVINGEGKTLPVDTSLADLKKVGKRKSTPCKTKTGIVCNICNLDFETRKTFLHHNNRYHAASRVHYPCPCCRDTFANAWNVYRHLYKVHRKSSAQVRRLRSKVLNKVYLGKVTEQESQCTKKKPKTVELLSEADKVKQEHERMEKENEDWIQNLEDDLGLQMCGGCGRRFERRAALNSHSQTCAKRIEVRKKSNRFYPISTVGSSSNAQNSNTKVPLFVERAHTTRSEVLLKTEMGNAENISSRLTPVSTHSEGTMSSGAKSGTSPAHSPLPPESTFSVPIPPVPATMYLRSPNSNGNPEKKIEIQIRRNYFKTEMGSGSASTAIGSTGSGLQHSLGKSGYRGTFPTVASTSGKLLEATSSSLQQTISEQGKKEIVESRLPLKLGNADEVFEVGEPKSHLSVPLGLDSNTYLSSCEIETSSSEFSKPPKNLNKIKKISKCHVKEEHVEDSYEQAASKMRYWRNYPNQNEYSGEEFHVQEDSIVKDEEQDNELISEFSPQKSFVGNVEQNLEKNEAGGGSSKSTTFKNGKQIIRQMKNRKKGRKGKYECYISRMINGKKRECVMCHKKYNKIACSRRQVAFKIGYYRFQCMLCDSRYLSRALCLAHIKDEHDIHKTKAPFQQKCIKIMLHHSKALRLRSARIQRMGRKSSANDSDAVSSIIVGKAEESTNKQVKLPKGKYTSKIQTGNDENGNQHLVMLREHCGVRTRNESKELAIEDEVSSVVAQEKGSANRTTVVKNTGNNDTDPKQDDSYTLLYSEDRKEHHESETLFTKPKAKSFLHTSPVDSDLILSEVSTQKRETGYPECEANYEKGMMEHDGAEQVGDCKKSTKRRSAKVKHVYKRRKCAMNERMDTILEFGEKWKQNEQSNTPAHQNSPGTVVAGLERKDINTTENTAAGTSKRKEILVQNTSVVQSIFKVLGGKSSMTETVIKDEVEEELFCDEASEKHTSRENGNGKRSKLRKVIKPDPETGTSHSHSNSGNEMISEGACQLANKVSGVRKNLSGELKVLPPLRRSRRLSGQKPDDNTDLFVGLAKRTNCQDNRHDQERSSSPNTVMLAKKCRTSTRGNLMNIGSNIASLKPLNDSEDKSNSTNIQCCEVHEGMKQDINLNCETDFSQDALRESCNGSVAKDGNYPLPMNSDYANEAREDNNQRKLRKAKSKQKHLQSSITLRKYGSTVDEKQSCLKAVSDLGSDEVNNVDEKCLDIEAAAEEPVLQKMKIKSNKVSYLRPVRKGKMKLHNPADLQNDEPKLNRAELVDTNIMEKQPTLPQESGMEISSDLEPSVENPSSGGETSEQQTALRKLVMEVIFGTGQDCDTTQQQLSATLNGTQYDSQYASSPSSSIDTSPSSSACSPAFFVNDTAASEEALKTKDEGKIMTLKKTVLNSFPEKKQRPVRNRIKLEKEDFIYDLPDRYRDPKRENEDRLSSCSSVTRSRQQTDLASSSVASSSDSTANLQNIPKLVLVRTNSSGQAAKLGNDNSSLSTENLVGASETFGAGSVAYKISKRKSQVQDAKCKLAASSKERTD